MGFFNELGKAFMGKPLGPNASSNNPVGASAQQGGGVVDSNGRKITPDIDVRNLKSYRQGSDKMLVKA